MADRIDANAPFVRETPRVLDGDGRVESWRRFAVARYFDGREVGYLVETAGYLRYRSRDGEWSEEARLDSGVLDVFVEDRGLVSMGQDIWGWSRPDFVAFLRGLADCVDALPVVPGGDDGV